MQIKKWHARMKNGQPHQPQTTLNRILPAFCSNLHRGLCVPRNGSGGCLTGCVTEKTLSRRTDTRRVVPKRWHLEVKCKQMRICKRTTTRNYNSVWRILQLRCIGVLQLVIVLVIIRY